MQNNMVISENLYLKQQLSAMERNAGEDEGRVTRKLVKKDQVVIRLNEDQE